MFGYVRPADGHLTAEDKSRFQAGLLRPVPHVWAAGTD